MRSFLRTAVVAVISSATTALLFGACAIQGAQPLGAPTSSPPGIASSTDSSASTATPVTDPSASASPSATGNRLQVAAAQAQVVEPAQAAQNPAVSVYQQNSQSVVNITSLAVLPTFGFGQQQQQAQPQGIGSGFFIDTDGRIVTNDHVVQDATQLAVTLSDKTTVAAQLLGRDADNDLAVIKIDPSATDQDGRSIAERIKPVTLGDSDQVTIGETAIAIGSPLGLAQTVTEGIVSARRNPFENSPVPGAQIADIVGGAIQTDAAINPGNSGGPLFNSSGQVIGVNSSILSQSGGNEGVGFSIPINVVKRVVPELIQTGHYRHPQLGVSTIALSDVSPQAKQQLGFQPNQRGLLVEQVTAGAQQAGIQAGTRRVQLGNQVILVGGDLIVAIDGQPVATGGDLRGWIENNKHPGDTTTVTVLRNDQRQDIQVTLSERPATQSQTGP